jgi:hypothetical protein
VKKLGFIVLAVVLALGVLGVGYAQWSHTINVNGTVYTGDIKPVFENADVSGVYNGVAYTVTGSTTNALTLTLSYAYPGWTGTFYFGIGNVGTSPIGTLAFGAVVVAPYPSDITVNGGILPAVPIAASTTNTGGSFVITINNSAVEDGTYSITIPIIATTP